MLEKIKHRIKWRKLMYDFDCATKKRNGCENDSEEWHYWDRRMDICLSQVFDEYERYWFGEE